MESGVSQGTVLEPLLFLCHINDLPLSVTSWVRLFADDCLIYLDIRSNADQQSLQKCVHQLESWASKWGMRFNATKCYHLTISRSKTPWKTNYKLENETLDQVSENPYLGITTSENMKWHHHTNNATKKANSILGSIRRNVRHCHQNFKETAYISLVRSILDYSSVAWDPYLNGDINKLENIQSRAAIFDKKDYSRQSSVTSMMKNLNWQPLPEKRRE